jgi:hypothetical protein
MPATPSRFDTQSTSTAAPFNTTRGGCSPLTLASPSMSLTRTGDPNVRAPSKLTAA